LVWCDTAGAIYQEFKSKQQYSLGSSDTRTFYPDATGLSQGAGAHLSWPLFRASRFGFTLDLAADPANLPRVQHLAALNRWRNVAAHQGTTPAGAA
jgi:hypothetical protein